jgi:hypothetical protein
MTRVEGVIVKKPSEYCTETGRGITLGVCGLEVVEKHVPKHRQTTATTAGAIVKRERVALCDSFLLACI